MSLLRPPVYVILNNSGAVITMHSKYMCIIIMIYKVRQRINSVFEISSTLEYEIDTAIDI